MKAMMINALASLETTPAPLHRAEMPVPHPAFDQVLIKVTACGVCHTEIDEIESRTPPPKLPIIPGHQIVGQVAATGSKAQRHKPGDRVGVAWIYRACGKCRFCLAGAENLCPDFKATGRDVNGGYAEYMVAPERYAHPIPDPISDLEAAPLLCAGAIGYRALKLTGIMDGQPLGLTGFGASAHLVIQMARHRFPNTPVHVFARSEKERRFAESLGAAWTGDTIDAPPNKLAAIIDTTPAWKPVVSALEHLEPGGRLVINAIRKETGDTDSLLHLDYARHLWMEKEIKSVANLTSEDVSECLNICAEAGIRPTVETFALEDANRAILEIKAGKIRGAKVLKISD